MVRVRSANENKIFKEAGPGQQEKLKFLIGTGRKISYEIILVGNKNKCFRQANPNLTKLLQIIVILTKNYSLYIIPFPDCKAVIILFECISDEKISKQTIIANETQKFCPKKGGSKLIALKQFC